MSASYYHTLAVRADGTAWGWGANYWGVVGDGTAFDNRPVPVQVKVVQDVSAVSAGYNHSVAVLADGTVWAWGQNDKSQLGNGKGPTAPRRYAWKN